MGSFSTCTCLPCLPGDHFRVRTIGPSRDDRVWATVSPSAPRPSLLRWRIARWFRVRTRRYSVPVLSCRALSRVPCLSTRRCRACTKSRPVRKLVHPDTAGGQGYGSSSLSTSPGHTAVCRGVTSDFPDVAGGCRMCHWVMALRGTAFVFWSAPKMNRSREKFVVLVILVIMRVLAPNYTRFYRNE